MDISFERLWSLFLNKLKIIILISAIASIGTFLVCNFLINKEYTSDSALLIQMNISEDQNANNELTVTKNLVDNYIRTLNTDNFFNGVAEKVNTKYNSEYTGNQLKKSATIKSSSSDRSSSDFNISFTSGDPVLSQEILSIIVESAIEYIDDNNFPNKIKCIESPTFTDHPSAPKTRNNTIYAFIIVFVIVSCFYFFKEIFDDRIKNVRDISNVYDIHVLGVVPDYSDPKKQKKKSYSHYDYTAGNKEE